MSKKTIIVVGTVLLSIAFIALGITAIVSIYEGFGGVPVNYSKNGKPTVFIGVAYIPVFLIALLIGLIYCFKSVKRFWKKFKNSNKYSKPIKRQTD